MKKFATIYFTRQGYHTSTYICEASTIKEARKLNLRDLLKDQIDSRNEDCGEGDEESASDVAKSLEEGEWCEVVTFEVVNEESYNDDVFGDDFSKKDFLNSLKE